MVDLYLQALMQREVSKGKPSAVDSQLSTEIDKLLVTEGEPEPGIDPFNTPAMKKARVKAEICEALQFKELSKYIESALKILIHDGRNRLDQDQYDALMQPFSHAQEYLAEPAETLENYQKILHLTDADMHAITQIAIEEFNEKQFDDCLAVFILLTTLRPDIADYWQRAGITAQKAGKLDLAIRFYNAALEIDKAQMGAHLFLIDCYLTLKKFDEAQSQYNAAKSLSEANEVDDAAKALLVKLETRLANVAGG